MTELAIIVNGLLAVIALWYTVETRKLRLQNQEQLSLLMKQVRLSVAPYIHVTLLNFQTALELLREEGKVPTEEPARNRFEEGLREKFSQPKVKFISKISNKSSKLALHLRVYVFDCRSKTFFRSDWGRTVLAEHESIEMEILSEGVSLEVIRKEMEAKYGEPNDLFHRSLNADCQASYILAFFKDIEGSSYVVKREFDINKDGLVEAKLNKLILPDD